MDGLSFVAFASSISAGLTMGIGAIGPALGEGMAVKQAVTAIAQQPDEKGTIMRTLFVSLGGKDHAADGCHTAEH